MTSNDAVKHILDFSFVVSRFAHLGPGQYVMTRSKDLRDSFGDLKSDDLADIRSDLIELSPYDLRILADKEECKKLLLDFDQKLKTK